jgi:hypothetical protein
VPFTQYHPHPLLTDSFASLRFAVGDSSYGQVKSMGRFVVKRYNLSKNERPTGPVVHFLQKP